MKTIIRSHLPVALLLLLVGCNWTRLIALRSQMGDIYDSTAWEGNENAILVFKKPLLTIDDLNACDVYPAVLDEMNAVLRYQRINAPPNTPTEYEIRLQFIEGKLTGLVLPSSLREGLGQDNIRRLLALIGAQNDGKTGLRPVPKSQLVSARLFPEIAAVLGREAVIDLMPLDPRNRPIHLKMTEERSAGYYTDFFISVKRRP